MSLYKGKYRIESTRLPGYDYSTPGYYFVTICTNNRECIFGEIKNGVMVLNNYGVITDYEWKRTLDIRQQLKSDYFVVMPNHFHCIVHITNQEKCNNCTPNPVDTPFNGVSTGFHGVSTGFHGVSTGFNGESTGFNSVSTGVDKPFHGVPTTSPHWKSGVLGAIIGQFKIQVTKRIRKNGYPGFGFQHRFHDHIIRNEKELFRIRQYIKNNPPNWEKDLFSKPHRNHIKEEQMSYAWERWMI